MRSERMFMKRERASCFVLRAPLEDGAPQAPCLRLTAYGLGLTAYGLRLTAHCSFLASPSA